MILLSLNLYPPVAAIGGNKWEGQQKIEGAVHCLGMRPPREVWGHAPPENFFEFRLYKDGIWGTFNI